MDCLSSLFGALHVVLAGKRSLSGRQRRTSAQSSLQRTTSGVRQESATLAASVPDWAPPPSSSSPGCPPRPGLGLHACTTFFATQRTGCRILDPLRDSQSTRSSRSLEAASVVNRVSGSPWVGPVCTCPGRRCRRAAFPKKVGQAGPVEQPHTVCLD